MRRLLPPERPAFCMPLDHDLKTHLPR